MQTYLEIHLEGSHAKTLSLSNYLMDLQVILVKDELSSLGGRTRLANISTFPFLFRAIINVNVNVNVNVKRISQH